MKYLDEFSDPELAGNCWIRSVRWPHGDGRSWKCGGGQTHSIIRHGIDQLLPQQIEMIHGPGCPVCVTPARDHRQSSRNRGKPDVIFCSFGDMLRVPGEFVGSVPHPRAPAVTCGWCTHRWMH